MDNTFKFTRLWVDANMFETSLEQMQEIHSNIIDFFIAVFPPGATSPLTMDGRVHTFYCWKMLTKN